jgi:hypothetical protein
VYDLGTKDSYQQAHYRYEADESELSEAAFVGSTGPKYETTERIFRLLHLLTASDCTRQDIFERLKDHYKINESDTPKVYASSQRLGKMLQRDIQFLRQMGNEYLRKLSLLTDLIDPRQLFLLKQGRPGLWKDISTGSNSSNAKRMVELGCPTCNTASCRLPD